MAAYIEDKVNSTESGTSQQKHLSREEFNPFKNDLYNVGISAGWTKEELSNLDLYQFTKFFVVIASTCEYYNATGTNAYTLTQSNGDSNLIVSKFNRPISIKFQVSNTNTSTATTISINGSSLPIKNLKDSTGASIGIGKLATGDVINATYFPAPIDEWRLQSKFSSTATEVNVQNKLFSVNSGRVVGKNADFLQRDSNTQITVLAGGGSPNLVYTHYNGNQNTLQSNQVISGITNEFNGLYKVIAEGSNPLNFFQIEGDFTAGNTAGSAVLTSVAGLDWTKIANGQLVSGGAIPAGAFIQSFIANTSITLNVTIPTSGVAGTARTVKFLNCEEGFTLPTTALIDGMYFININPLQTYKRVGGSFVLTPFTQFNEFRIASGIIPATLISYAYNGLFTYSGIVTINSIYTLNCNIGSSYTVNGFIIDNTTGGATNETVPINNFNYDSTGTGTGTNISQTNNNIVKIITALVSLAGIRGFSTFYPRNFTSGTIILTCQRSF